MINIETFSRPGKKVNEDSVFACEEFGFVIDGATGYGSVKITDEESDAKWFSNTWKKYLIKNLGNTNKTINEIMKEGVVSVEKKLKKFENYKHADIKPSAAISLFRKNNDKLECFCLADCSLLITKKDNSFELFTTNDITDIDNKNKKFILEIAKRKQLSYIRAKKEPEVIELMVNMFKNRNTNTGGWVLSNSLEAIDNGKYKKYDLKDIKSIYGFSDGYSQIFDLFQHWTLNELLRQFQQGKTLSQVYEVLYNLQEKDKDCTTFIRSKVRDDSTALKYIIEK